MVCYLLPTLIASVSGALRSELARRMLVGGIAVEQTRQWFGHQTSEHYAVRNRSLAYSVQAGCPRSAKCNWVKPTLVRQAAELMKGAVFPGQHHPA
jgi:hypothetical protein